MKLLFDQNLSFKLCQQLNDLFPDAQQVRLVGLQDADDIAIWRFAQANGFAIVTLDADFAELAAVRGPPPKVIWLRSGNMRTATVASLIRNHAATIFAFGAGVEACLEIY